MTTTDTPVVTPAPPAESAPTSRVRLSLERALVVVLLLAPPAIVTWAFRPGYMNADTLIQYNQTQGGQLTDWYAPVLQRLWDAALALGIGHPTFVLFDQTLALTVGFYLVLRAALGRVVAAVASVVLIFSPPVFSQVMLLGRDTWLPCFVVLQVGCSIRWTTAARPAARLWLAGSLVCGFLAVATRQNAAPLALFVVAATARRWLAGRPAKPARVGSRLRVAVASTAVAGVLSVGSMTVVAVATRALGAQDLQPEAVLYAYDLAGLSVRTDEMLLGPQAFPEQSLTELRAHWNPQNVLYILLAPEDPGVHAMWDPDAADELAEDWREEVPRHPRDYLAVRWTLFSKILGVSAPPTVVMHPGVDGNSYDFSLANPDANEAFRGYMRIFATDDTLIYGSAISRPIWYLAIAAAAALFLLRAKRRTASGALEVGLLALGALAYEATFFFVAMGEGYRYSYPSVTLGLLAGVFAVATLLSGRRGALEPTPRLLDELPISSVRTSA